MPKGRRIIWLSPPRTRAPPPPPPPPPQTKREQLKLELAPLPKRPRQLTLASAFCDAESRGRASPKPVHVDVYDLYCCAGGFSCGAVQAGHTVKLAVDYWEEALHCHAINHPETEHLLLALGDDTHDTLLEKLPPPATAETPWHLHGSPPCQLLSRARGVGARADRWDEGMANVVYFLRVARETKPSGWTMEEVANPVLIEYFEELRSTEPDFLDFSVFNMYEFNICQKRKRLIAGSPHLIRRLRDRRDPTAHARVCDVCPDRPDDAIGIRGNSFTVGRRNAERNRKGLQGARHQRTAEQRVKPGGLSGPAPCVCSGGNLTWTREGGEVVRSLNVRELSNLQSFPSTYEWPSRLTHAQPLIGNAVPPLFARQMMLDYRL